jgi:hypothetical protein
MGTYCVGLSDLHPPQLQLTCSSQFGLSGHAHVVLCPQETDPHWLWQIGGVWSTFTSASP